MEAGPGRARRLGTSLEDYWAGRHGTAAGLLAIDDDFDECFYAVPAEAVDDPAAVAEAFDPARRGGEVVLDVQTHFVAGRPETRAVNSMIRDVYAGLAPSWWRGLDDLAAYDLAEYLRCVYVESDTAVAVLTSGPGIGPERMLHDAEMAGVREMVDRLGGVGRLLNHRVVHADVPGEIEAMERDVERFGPVGWKCYTLGLPGRGGGGWWLDDEAVGVPFVEKAIEVGVPLICAHKGISAMVDTGSPRDVGPIAAAFPEVDFVIYHSGWEYPTSDDPEEGPYTQETAEVGVNRLITSLRSAGLGPGCNVYAELGSTWFGLIRRPDEAAHVLGKLLMHLGEDNVIWGTDAIWYGPSQVAVDAFRAFDIPLAYQERFGYPPLTPDVKDKILGANAARVYGIDLGAAAARAVRDDLAWVRDAVTEFRQRGVPLA